MKQIALRLIALICASVVFAAERPNIVLFLCDDLGFSDVGCYGGEIPTPNIDALAKSGLRFTQFYNNAVCGPSRASLLTGLYAQQVGHSGRGWNDATDFTKCVSLGEVLKTAGYRTLMVGKWQERDLPAKRGFDRFFGPQCAGKISYFDEVQFNPFFLDETRWKLPDDFYLTDALTDHAAEFVEEALTKPDVPFFLYLAHVAPHWPLHAREAEIRSGERVVHTFGTEKTHTVSLLAIDTAGRRRLLTAEVPVGTGDARDGTMDDFDAETFGRWDGTFSDFIPGLGLRYSDVFLGPGIDRDVARKGKVSPARALSADAARGALPGLPWLSSRRETGDEYAGDDPPRGRHGKAEG